MTAEPIRVDVNPELKCAETLASRFYTDPAILALEKSRIFHRTWQLVGTLSQPCGERNGLPRTIADPETYLAFDLAGEPVVVVRDKAGVLRAFSNALRNLATIHFRQLLARRSVARGVSRKHPTAGT